MITREGKCKFCRQMAVVSVPETFDEDAIDNAVTEICKCPEAQAKTMKEYNRTTAKGFMKDVFKNDDYMREFMNGVVDAVMDEAADSVTVKRSDWRSADIEEVNTYRITKNKDNKIIINSSKNFKRKEKF